MQLLLVRHAAAVKQGRRAPTDGERPLTRVGARAFAEAARGLAHLLRTPAVTLTSPLVRARQTAEIALTAWRSRQPPIEVPALAQPAAGPVLKVLSRYQRRKLVAVFGHEPGLSTLLAHLLGARTAGVFGLKKGGAVLLDVGALTRRREARLVWFLPPRLLRRHGDAR